MHFNSRARSNILSEGLLKIKGYSIFREEEPEDAIIVTSPDGTQQGLLDRNVKLGGGATLESKTRCS